MTRINCIDPELLADQHLFIEFREITRVHSLHRELKDYGKYVLGTGHVKFFYNKGLYLAKRLEALTAEMDKRKRWNYTPKTYKTHCKPSLHLDWEPNKADKLANLIRLSKKIVERPGFYTYNGTKVSDDFYSKLMVI